MNLFVGNLNPETNAAGLRKLFSEFGEVVSSKVIMDNATGQSRGFGFVEMADKFHSYDAIDNLDCTYFEGNIISVKEAKQNTTKGGPGGGHHGHGGGGGNRSFKPRPPRRDNFNNDYNRGGNDYNRGNNDYNRNSNYNNSSNNNYNSNR